MQAFGRAGIDVAFGKTLELGILGFTKLFDSLGSEALQSLLRALEDETGHWIPWPKAEEQFALGRKEWLNSFAKDRGANTWETYQHMPWKNVVSDKIRDPNVSIHVNLEGIGNVWAATQRGALETASPMDWELYTIYSNPSVWDTVTFWQNGSIVPSPFR